jgi:hypothetical protein
MRVMIKKMKYLQSNASSVLTFNTLHALDSTYYIVVYTQQDAKYEGDDKTM